MSSKNNNDFLVCDTVVQCVCIARLVELSPSDCKVTGSSPVTDILACESAITLRHYDYNIHSLGYVGFLFRLIFTRCSCCKLSYCLVPSYRCLQLYLFHLLLSLVLGILAVFYRGAGAFEHGAKYVFIYKILSCFLFLFTVVLLEPKKLHLATTVSRIY